MKSSILEGNELIAIFMGYETNEDGSFLMGCILPQFRGSDHNEWCSATELNLDFSKKEDCEKAIKIGEFYWNISPNNIRYHNSWDWIMPVVEKIEMSTPYELVTAYDNRDEFKGWSVHWFTLLPKDEILGHIEDERFSTKIDATWFGIVEYIKLNNKK